ncbi:RUS1 [Acrasis kona]|uniref:RUS1 n=1 Tax=Acrasis kona TaxID=1008807 RepID=A0AAW2YT69_9EUKA
MKATQRLKHTTNVIARGYHRSIIPRHGTPYAKQSLHQTQFNKESIYLKKDEELVKTTNIINANQQSSTKTATWSKNSTREFLYKKIFIHLLPKGYPDAVHQNYMSYVKWQSLVYVASSMGGVLSMQALLYAVGLGSGAIPLAATLNWVIKDGLGQLGGVIFASKVSTNFDADPKKWRFRGEFALIASTLIEILTPLFPKLFIPLASLANIGKNVSWLSASATRASINLSFTRKDNLADLTAKSGSQAIAGSLVGTGLGILASACIGPEFSSVVTSFAVIASAQLYALYKAVGFVELNVLNKQRAEIVSKHFLKTGVVMTPSDVSKKESFVAPYQSSIIINPPLERFTSSISELEEIRSKYAGRGYMINKNNLMFISGASTSDVLCGLLCSLNNSEKDYSEQEFIEKLMLSGWKVDHDFVEERQNRVEFLT